MERLGVGRGRLVVLTREDRVERLGVGRKFAGGGTEKLIRR
ncbi:hypothetical protein [Streptomyces sp. c-19]